MKPLKKITRASCKTVRAELNKELVSIGAKLGLDISAGNASYDDDSITFKVKCSLAGVDIAAKEFERVCYQFNLPASAYRAEFNWNGKMWNLIGLKTRSPKLPIIACRVGESDQYKLPEKAVRSLAIVKFPNAAN